MSKTPRRPDYTRKLSRRIVLADGRTLITLKDAADLIGAEFGTVNLRGGLLDHVTRLLIEAGERGGRERIKAATVQLVLVLRERRLL